MTSTENRPQRRKIIEKDETFDKYDENRRNYYRIFKLNGWKMALLFAAVSTVF